MLLWQMPIKMYSSITKYSLSAFDICCQATTQHSLQTHTKTTRIHVYKHMYICYLLISWLGFISKCCKYNKWNKNRAEQKLWSWNRLTFTYAHRHKHTHTGTHTHTRKHSSKSKRGRELQRVRLSESERERGGTVHYGAKFEKSNI